MIRALFALLIASLLGGCAIKLVPDYTDLRGVTLPVGLLAPDYVPVNAAVFTDLSEVNRICKLAFKDDPQANATQRYMACAIVTKEGKCLLIKWANTTWDYFGHGAGHCLFSARASAGNLTGIPPHFMPRSIKGSQQ